MPTVLLLAASPHDRDRLRLGYEVKRIKEALKRSKNRENWQVVDHQAATVEDMTRAILEYGPTVVHFSGHGEGEYGLCFEDDAGYAHPTHADPLPRTPGSR